MAMLNKQMVLSWEDPIMNRPIRGYVGLAQTMIIRGFRISDPTILGLSLSLDGSRPWYSVIVNLGGLYQWSLTMNSPQLDRGGKATDGVSFFLAMFLAPNMAAQSMPSK